MAFVSKILSEVLNPVPTIVDGKAMTQSLYIWRAEAIFADDKVWTGKNNASGVVETTQGTVLLMRE
ncbi:MAG: hypothetical protein RR137_06705 [Odoribacter sp.]